MNVMEDRQYPDVDPSFWEYFTWPTDHVHAAFIAERPPKDEPWQR